MFFRDKLYEYKQFCERIASSKSKYHSPPPKQFPFLKQREKKKQMEKERLDDIKYNQNLLITKLKTMYNKHNKYHPANMKFLSLPPSLKFSTFSQKYYEMVRQNKYLGQKIVSIQNGTGNYNKNKINEEYKKSKKISETLVQCSKYKNGFLNIISPYTYEKRLIKIMKNKKSRKRLKTPTEIFIPKIYNNKMVNYFTTNNSKEKIRTMSDLDDNKIKIEREYVLTMTKDETSSQF